MQVGWPIMPEAHCAGGSGSWNWPWTAVLPATNAWLLDRELLQLEWLEAQARVLEQEIERRVVPFAEPMRRLMTIPGIDQKTAWTIMAEIGVDMNVFPDARHLASWAGLCPGNRESCARRPGRLRIPSRPICRRSTSDCRCAREHRKR